MARRSYCISHVPPHPMTVNFCLEIKLLSLTKIKLWPKQLHGCGYGAERLTWSNAVHEVILRKSP